MAGTSSSATTTISDWWSSSIHAPFGFKEFLPIQRQIIPWLTRALRSRLHVDACVSAPTGSGKTLCYLIPVVQMLLDEWRGAPQLRALVIVPTSVLALQVTEVAKRLTTDTSIKVGRLSGEGDDAISRTVTLWDGTVRTYSAIDLLISTPQRVLQQVGTESGLFLGNIRVIVLDEADKVLYGAFTTLALRIIDLIVRSRPASCPSALHKILSSATLTSHIAKVSEAQLVNAKYFSLDTEGKTVDPDGAPQQQQKPSVATSKIRSNFVLPPTLNEHFVITENATRHAMLLRVLHFVHKDICRMDRSILIFCSTAETARVMFYFVRAAGFRALEFTSLSTIVDRRRAAIESFSGGSAANGTTTTTTVVVSTDALMRGIDFPGVGAVIMYDAPTSIQQYIHRAGRTARAGSVGHAFCILSKIGASGTTEDGEVARFKSFSDGLSRSSPAKHERELQKGIDAAAVAEADNLLAEAQRAISSTYEGGRAFTSSSVVRRSAGRKRQHGNE